MGKTEEQFHSLYDGKIKLRFLPNSHRYSIDGDQKLGVTTITDIIKKDGLMLWPLDEAIRYLKDTLVNGRAGDQATLYSAGELETIIKEAAERYKKKQVRGTDAGTNAHAWVERYLRAFKDLTPFPELPLKIATTNLTTEDEIIRIEDHNHLVDALQQFVLWFTTNNCRVLHTERPVYSIKYDYCGTFDILLTFNNKNYLLDLKTSNPSREFDQGIYPENFAQLGGYDIAFAEEFPDINIDGHGIINLSKKTGKMNVKILEGAEQRKQNRDFFIYCLGVKRGMQNRTRLLSNRYQDKRNNGQVET